MNNADLEAKYRYIQKDATSDSELFNVEYEKIKKDRDDYRKLFLLVESTNDVRLFDDSKMMPFNIDRIINDVMISRGMDNNKTPASDSDIVIMVKTVSKWLENLHYIMFNRFQEMSKMVIPETVRASTGLINIIVRSHMYAKAMQFMTPSIVTQILNRVYVKYQTCLISYGSAVGILAAQSFSEPLTQYMIDAHHRSALGGSTKDDIHRTKEVIGGRSTEKMINPKMTINLVPEISKDKTRVQEVANSIEEMIVRQFVVSQQIFFEKFGMPVHPVYVEERSMINNFVKMNIAKQPPNDLIKWCIRYVINKTTLILKNMPLELLVNKIQDTYPECYVVYTPENSKNIILRIYIRASEFKTTVELKNIIEYSENIMSVIIRGIPGIKSTEIAKLIRHIITEDGSIKKSDGEWKIRTSGTNIPGVLNNKYVVAKNIMSNSIMEIQELLGIEAARHKILIEMDKLGEGGINQRQYMIYADEMTFTGVVTSIERSGLSKREPNNVLLRLGFSAPLGTLQESAIMALEDKVVGITGKLLVGSTPTLGTTYNSFHVNHEMIRKYTKSTEDVITNL